MPATTRAHTAVVIAFFGNGVAFASFISRTPALRDGLGLSTAGLGLLLLCLSAGAVAGLPLAGPLVARFGPAATVLAGALLVAAGLGSLAAGLAGVAVAPAAVGLALTGLGSGVWDVAMNVEGAEVERRRGRSVMPRLHAAFSLGTVTGAGLGAGAAALALPLQVQVLAVAVAVPVAMVPCVRGFLPATTTAGSAGSGLRAAWREPRTLVVGVLVLGFAFTEGAANDWIAVALVDGHGLGETGGALGFALFVSAMTGGRLVGGALLERFGRVPVLRVSALLAVGGLGLVVVGPGPGWALAGALFWGLGAALGFPVGMSAAADDPTQAAARVSVVSSIGYTAFLAGPPLIGLLAEAVGIRTALTVVLVALAAALLAAGSVRPPAGPATPGPDRG